MSPLYTFRCGSCGRNDEEVRPVKDMDAPRRCLCGSGMERIFNFHGAVHDGGGWTPYQPAFGKTFSSKRDFKDHLRKLRYESGVDVVEVGNENVKRKPKEVEPDKKAAYDALRRAIK